MDKERKNALIVAYNDLNNSGVPNVIYQTVKALHKNFDFDIVVFCDDLYYYRRLVDEGITNINIINMHKDKSNNKIKRIVYEVFTNPHYQYKTILKLFRNKHYDILHSFKEYGSWPFLKAAKKTGVKKRVVHTTVIHDEPKSFLIKHSKKKTLNYATNFVGVTKDACEKAWSNKSYRVIHFSYDESNYYYGKSLLESDELVLTQVGTYSSNKNQLFAIEVLGELVKLYKNTKLLLIGSEREKCYLDKIKAHILFNDLNNNIEIIDGSLGAEKYAAYTSFYILPSHHEGASLVVVEAQASGVKVFASTGVPKEMNVGGIIYLSLDDGPKKWAESIFEEYQKNGNTRHSYNTSSFSSKSFCKSITDLYLND